MKPKVDELAQSAANLRSRPSIAVVGAGMSGLMCARKLSDHGLSVTVFEKSRGVGGRMATRRTSDNLSFDHGAQYFTARDERFQHYVDSWLQNGVVARWLGRIVVLRDGQVVDESRDVDRFVGVPGMNAICRHLVDDVAVRLETPVTAIHREENRWRIVTAKASEGAFDFVLVSAPAAQTEQLTKEAAPQIAQRARAAVTDGCWAVLASWGERLPMDYDGAFVQDSPLSWIARNGSKPSRKAAETWVLHASADWSRPRIDESPETIAPQLLDAFWQSVGEAIRQATYCTAHRWRYALPTQPLPEPYLFDRDLQLGACGDWCNGPRVEGAFLSGCALAGHVLRVVDRP